MTEGDYEYPLSPPDERDSSTTPCDSTITHQPREMASLPTPSTGSKSPNQRHDLTAIRQDRSPPRTPAGEMTCEHPECGDKFPIFRRLCEWNKHMDRHERPYKCNELGCETAQGFTYSGGLLRHQREVHRLHSTGKDLLYCPFQNCARAAGDGFTRKENLEEHKRRRHQEELPSLTPSGPSLKRKRLMTPLPEPAEVENDGVSAEMEINNVLEQYPAVKRLITMKNHYIQRQEAELLRLQSVIRNIPSQIYGVDSRLAVQQSGALPMVLDRATAKPMGTWHHD